MVMTKLHIISVVNCHMAHEPKLRFAHLTEGKDISCCSCLPPLMNISQVSVTIFPDDTDLKAACLVNAHRPALPFEQSSSCFLGISMRVMLALWQSLKCLQCLPWMKSPYSSVLGSWSHPSWWHVQTPEAELWEWWLQWPLTLPLQEF